MVLMEDILKIAKSAIHQHLKSSKHVKKTSKYIFSFIFSKSFMQFSAEKSTNVTITLKHICLFSYIFDSITNSLFNF